MRWSTSSCNDSTSVARWTTPTFLFLSDNGYFLGEHRQPHGKDAPYDAASRVPLIARGPGIAAGSSVDEIALNIDLFPTIAELAGIAAPRSWTVALWSRSFAGSDRGWREVALIEGFGKETESNEGAETSTPAFRALRSEDDPLCGVRDRRTRALQSPQGPVRNLQHRAAGLEIAPAGVLTAIWTRWPRAPDRSARG